MVVHWPHGPHDGDHGGRGDKEGLVGLRVLLCQVDLLLLEGRLHLAKTAMGLFRLCDTFNNDKGWHGTCVRGFVNNFLKVPLAA